MKKRNHLAPLGACRCEACGQRFRSLSAFDFHRSGSFTSTLWEPARRRCLTVAEMSEHGMVLNQHGAWVTGVSFFAKKIAA